MLRILFALVAIVCLVACGGSGDFNGGTAKGILEGSPVDLEAEQVSLSQQQFECGVQSDLWDAPALVANDRTVAKLTQKARDLKFNDDVTIESKHPKPFVQVRGAFSLQVDEISGIHEGDEQGTKRVDAKVSVKVPNSCFSAALPMMGVKKGDFKEDTPASFLFRQGPDGWKLEKLVH